MAFFAGLVLGAALVVVPPIVWVLYQNRDM